MKTDDILNVAKFAYNADPRKFKEIFGDEDGKNLYEKWKKDYKGNFLEFFGNGLDSENQEILANAIN